MTKQDGNVNINKIYEGFCCETIKQVIDTEIQEAQEYIEMEDWEEAINVLNSILIILHNNATIKFIKEANEQGEMEDLETENHFDRTYMYG